MAVTTFAAIDVGSNEVSLKIFELGKKNQMKELTHVRHIMELGSDTYVSGYISNHHKRNISSNILSEQQARTKLSPVVSAEGTGKLCYIPTDFASEILCYEFKATLGDNTFLIYINAETGKEEDVLMLLVSEYGTLTI